MGKFTLYAISPLYRPDDRLMTTPASYNVRIVSACHTIASGFKTHDLAAAWLANHVKAHDRAAAWLAVRMKAHDRAAACARPDS